MSKPDRPWGELLSITVDRLSTTVEEMHRAIALPWFRLAGPAAPALRGAYAGAVSVAYGTVRMVAAGAAMVVDGIRTTPTVGERRRSDSMQAFANAVWGDELAHRGSAMAIGTDARDPSGRVVACDADSLARSFPDATPRIAVLLHGLGQTEQRFHRSSSGRTLVETLAASTFTPVTIRYNSGRRVADTGLEVSALIESLVTEWPVPVTEIVVVGFSMGGLVAREAIHAGTSDERHWTGAVRHVVTVATPHAGSPIERGAEVASRALVIAPQSRPLGRFLDGRSAGIRDLRSGAGLPPVPDGIRHHRIAGVVTSDASHPVGALIGDLVVRPGSATTQPNDVLGEQVVIGGRRHYDLLDDQSVARHILDWIEPG